MNRIRSRKLSSLLLVALLVNVILPIVYVQQAHATSLTDASIRLDRMGADAQFNTTTGDKILIVLKPQTVGSIAKVRVTFPTSSAFTVDTTASNFATSTTGLPSTYQGTSLTAATVTNSVASAVSGGAITFDVTSMSSATTLYGFFLTCTSTTCVTNPSSGNAGVHIVTVETLDSGGTTIDSTDVAVQTLSTASSDQVSVSATVAPSFNFALSGNSIALGTLSTSARTTGNVTVDVDTNANNGWVAWIKSANAALSSTATGDSISSTDTGSCVTAAIGSKGYVVDVNAAAGTSAGGVLSVASEYDCTDNQAGGVPSSTAYEEIANRTGVVNSDTLTLTAIATISPTTKAASDYSDTWTVIGAGNF